MNVDLIQVFNIEQLSFGNDQKYVAKGKQNLVVKNLKKIILFLEDQFTL